MNHQEILRQVE